MPGCQQERYTVEERGHLTLSGNGNMLAKNWCKKRRKAHHCQEKQKRLKP
jgi:hypothetical protein